jgi:hypothetical protein
MPTTTHSSSGSADEDDDVDVVGGAALSSSSDARGATPRTRRRRVSAAPRAHAFATTMRLGSFPRRALAAVREGGARRPRATTSTRSPL